MWLEKVIFIFRQATTIFMHSARAAQKVDAVFVWVSTNFCGTIFWPVRMAVNNIVATAHTVRNDDQSRLSPSASSLSLQQQERQRLLKSQPQQQQQHPIAQQQAQQQQQQLRRASIPPMSPPARPGVRFADGVTNYGAVRVRSRFVNLLSDFERWNWKVNILVHLEALTVAMSFAVEVVYYVKYVPRDVLYRSK